MCGDAVAQWRKWLKLFSSLFAVCASFSSFFVSQMALSKATCKVADKDQFIDLLKKHSIAEDVIKHRGAVHKKFPNSVAGRYHARRFAFGTAWRWA